MRHAVIMAGGSGTRLWPLSRRMRPKQLMKLFEGKSLLQHARLRLEGVFEPEQVWVITSQHYLDLVAEELPDVPRENLIGEPMGRDTSNAVGLAAHLLHRRDPDATMAVFTADHLISPREKFAAAIERGLEAAEKHPDALLTYGIEPDAPHTGYGYVRRGEPIEEGVYECREFREKPDDATAREYVESGEYYWNSGMFAWTTAAILPEFKRCMPENDKLLEQIAGEWEAIAGTDTAAEKFAALEKISIDYGVMEKARRVLIVPMSCKWLDLGSWTSIAATRTPDQVGNVAVAENALMVEGENNIVVSEDDHLICTLGLSDVVVVHSADATLVCRREDVQKIKQLAEHRQRQFGEKYE